MEFKERESSLCADCRCAPRCETDDFWIDRMENETGWGEMKSVHLAPGIRFCYNDMHMHSCCPEAAKPGCMRVDFCRRGCRECALKNGFKGLVGEGDMAVCGHANGGETVMPLGRYEGLTLELHIDEAQKSVEQLAPRTDLDLQVLTRKFCAGSQPCLMRTPPEMERIFQELYHVDDRIRRPYMLLKVLELLLMLTIAEDYQELPHFSQEVVEQTQCVYDSVIQNPFRQRTTKQLCREFHISNTNLRSCFRALYGQPLATFARRERMKKAASVLVTCPEQSVGRVAELAGYQNQSKFTAAFKNHFNLTPMQYRRECTDKLG